MAKKSFKDSINPAMSFISQESVEKEEAGTSAGTAKALQKINKAPEGYKINPLYLETKSKRLQLLIQPSLHEKLKKKAQTDRTSVNDVVNTILLKALSEE